MIKLQTKHQINYHKFDSIKYNKLFAIFTTYQIFLIPIFLNLNISKHVILILPFSDHFLFYIYIDTYNNHPYQFTLKSSTLAQQSMKKQTSQPSSSFLTDEQAQNAGQPSKKQSQQFKALFLKNLRLQSKQKGTNCCQILTPILCILFTFLMKTIAQQNMKVGAIFQPLDYPVKFNSFQDYDTLNPGTRSKLQWVTYSCTHNCDASILGSNDGTNNKSGILGLVQPTYNGQVTYHPDPINNPKVVVPKTVPFFLKHDNVSINAMLYDRIYWVNTNDMNQTKKTGGLQFLPDGAYNITTLNDEQLRFQAKVNDMRQLQTIKSNGISKMTMLRPLKQNPAIIAKKQQYTSYTGILLITHWLTSAFIQHTTNKTVQSGIFFMPEDQSGITFIQTLISFISVLIFPVSLSLLFPVYLYTVVLEKEQKLIQMMKMNGMKISSYWFVYFIFNLVLGILTNAIFVIFGIVFTRMRFFLETDPLLLIVTLLGWTLAQIGLAVFFQTFLNKSRSANIIGYLISIWTSMIGSTLCIGVYQYPNQMPIGPRLFAPFAFPRIIYLMLSGCSEGKCYGNIAHIPNQMKQQIAMLYINFVFFFLLGTYLFEIVPQEFGVTRSFYFPITMMKRFFKKKFGKNQRFSEDQLEDDQQLKQYLKNNDQDDFSKKQRQDIVSNKDIINQNPLVINNLRKLYYKEGMGKMYAAVKSFNLKVGPKQTFGLLGPNGAGKTTLISMITGMFQPNYGNAWIGGYDIKTSVQKAQLQMGVCPQFDLLWPQLTVSEHLYFYARLKGIPRKQIDKKVSRAIEQVKLTQFKNFPSSSLSGGMKRRLSVAISLVGDPRIVFLDEPSTGLDPQNRRQLWQVLAKCQKQRAIFITTHMMQQADALCNRIGIITNGVLRTVAPQVTLKRAYGGGYRVSISVARQQRKLVDRQSLKMLQKGDRIQDYNDQHEQDLKRSVNSFILTQQNQKNQKSKQRVRKLLKFMQQHFPGSILMKSYNGYLIFKVQPKYKVSQIFQTVQKMQKQLQVVDVAITNSSLEDVFMNVVKQHQIQYQNQNQNQDNNSHQSSGKNYEQLQSKNKQESFMSFPNTVTKSKVVEEGINGSSGKMNHVASSIISKHKSSVMSHEGKGKKQVEDQHQDQHQDHQDHQDHENNYDNQNQPAKQNNQNKDDQNYF